MSMASVVFFFKQKTAYELRISDWSSDVCSSDLDAKGRHTTTNRQLHLLPTGGVLIDSPGIREVGLAGDEESVDATFADVEDVATTCYFNDCTHSGEPGCAVALAVEAGELTRDREIGRAHV